MGGQQSSSNKKMIDNLIMQNSYPQTATVEAVFRAVDRAMYYEFDEDEDEPRDLYDDAPWRHGNLHLSAPCIYVRVVEALDLKPGMSFLNLGSGTGYLNTIVGLLVGPNGLSHGIEYHSDVVEYAHKRLSQFKQKSHAVDKYDFVEPIFIKGNCMNLNPDAKYDRVYLGAACLPELESFMKKLVKPNGGILVMPFMNHLMRYVRIAEDEWTSENLMVVSFSTMLRPSEDEPDTIINMPKPQPMTLKNLCRIVIRQKLRRRTESLNPDLRDSDNLKNRQKLKDRKAKQEVITIWIRHHHHHSQELRKRKRHSSCESSEASSGLSSPKRPGNGSSDQRIKGCWACRQSSPGLSSSAATDSSSQATGSNMPLAAPSDTGRRHDNSSWHRLREPIGARGSSCSSSSNNNNNNAPTCSRNKRLLMGSFDSHLELEAMASEMGASDIEFEEAEKKLIELDEKERERERKPPKRRESECQRYHNHMSGYIRQLPLPGILHSYLNYDRIL